MKIAVCVKQVPDTESVRRLRADFTLDRAAADGVLNELDEFAIEEALRLVEAHGGDVTVITMGPETAMESLRKAMSMGADRAIHVQDEALAASDAVTTAKVLAKVIARGEYDLVLFGAESTDARTGIVPAMAAEVLGWPALTLANRVAVVGTDATIDRATDRGYVTLSASTPAVISTVWAMNEPRYPSFKGIMSAKKKPIEHLTLGDLGMEPATVGAAGAWTTVVAAVAQAAKSKGRKIVDDGSAAVQVAQFLSLSNSH